MTPTEALEFVYHATKLAPLPLVGASGHEQVYQAVQVVAKAIEVTEKPAKKNTKKAT